MIGCDRRSQSAARTLALALALVGTVSGARAEGPHPTERAKHDAQEHLDRGNDLFTRDEFARALAEFQAAFDLYPSPKLHFNLGQCERALGHAEAAAAHFESFLAGAADVAPELRAEAERYLAEARRPPAAASVDASREPAAPAPAALPPPAAPALQTPLVTALPPPPARTPIYQRWWFWAGVGAVVVGAAVTTIALTRPRDPACQADYCL